MTELDKVTVIVVTYNSAHCWPMQQGLLDACRHVIVSDNASTDDTVTEVQRRWPHVRVLAHQRNLGFGAANNRALALVDTPYSLLLNPDCELSPEALVELLRVAQTMPEAAILAPQLLTSSGQPDINYRWVSTGWKSRGDGASGPVCVGFICGAALLLRMGQAPVGGWFDEDFFLYYEDDDLCLRLFQEQKPMIVVPHVQARHHSRGSVRGRRPWRSEYWRGYHHVQSKLTFMQKHRNPQLAASARRRLLWQTLLVLPVRFLVFSPKLVARMWGRFVGLRQWGQHG